MNKPAQHRIQPTSGARVPSLCVFLDTETLSEPGHEKETVEETFALAVAVAVRRERGQWTRRVVRRFTRPRDLWDWIHELEQERKTVWLFGHNVGFDITVSHFWDFVAAGEWRTSDVWRVAVERDGQANGKHRGWKGTLVITDPPTIICLRSKHGTLRIVDTFNYFNGPLSELGSDIGLPKLARPASDSLSEQWFEYCQRDCEILERAVCGWIDQWANLECGSWRTTAAGLGYSAWRNTIGKTKILLDHSEQQIVWARGAYYGGQVEVFYQGTAWPTESEILETVGQVIPRRETDPQGPVYNLDVHALYPYVMKEFRYPRKFTGWTQGGSVERLAQRSRGLLPIALVGIQTESETYPVRRDGDYLHAVGEFSTWLCGQELHGAIERGHVVKVYDVAWYEPADLFTRFVDRWIELRHAAEDGERPASAELAKLVLNSLSGKFAQHKVVWIDAPQISARCLFGEWEVFVRETKEIMRFRAIAGNVQQFTHVGEGRDAFPAISAHITANGREHMRILRGLCPARSILYQDTDGIFALEAAKTALEASGWIHRRKLGHFRQKAVYAWLGVLGFKFYASPDGVVCPGLRKDAKLERPGVYRQQRFQRLADKLNGYSGPTVTVRTGSFTPVGTLGNRTATPSGWTDPPRRAEAALPF